VKSCRAADFRSYSAVHGGSFDMMIVPEAANMPLMP
jgi:hypothetical protein